MVRAGILGLVLLVASACRTYDPAVFDERLRAATFDTYWGELDRHYPYFERKQIDWGAVRGRYRDQAVAAGTRSDFFKVLVRMVNELDDPHVSLSPSKTVRIGLGSGGSTVPCSLAVVDRRLYFEWLPGVVGTDSPRADLHVPIECPRLLAIDGCPVRRPELAYYLLTGEPRTRSRLSLEWRTKPPEDVLAERPDSISWSGPIGTLGGAATAGDVGYLWLRSFGSDDGDPGPDALVAAIDTFIDRVAGTRACVLDLQYNSGGSFDVMVRVLGRLFREPVFAGRGRFLRIGPFRFVRDVDVQPRPEVYPGELVVLVNAETASAGESMAWTLAREHRAILVGERTVGADAGVDDVEGPDGTRLMYGRFPVTDAEGRDYQDVGIEPDVRVPLTLASVERHGYRKAQTLVREERLRKALEILRAEDRFEALATEALRGPNALWENGRDAKP